MPVPDLSAGDMLVEVQAATLCGTDVHFWHGTVGGSPDPPYIPGHGPRARSSSWPGTVTMSPARPVVEGDRII